jgi:hypothetical protein
MAAGNFFDTLKEAASGLMGGLGDMATTAAEEAGLGDLAAKAGDAVAGATGVAGDVAAQAGDAVAGVQDQATGAVAGVTDTLAGGGK